MKKVELILISLVVLALFISCSTIEQLTDMSIEDVVSDTPTAGMPAKIDLRKNEILCAADPDRKLMDSYFYTAKILTAASAQTKNQAEVIYVRDGSKGWAIPIPSHVATKEEMELAKVVFYHSSAWREELSEEAYRKGDWHLGTISSVDDLFKGMVEVDGNQYYVKFLRIPEKDVK